MSDYFDVRALERALMNAMVYPAAFVTVNETRRCAQPVLLLSTHGVPIR